MIKRNEIILLQTDKFNFTIKYKNLAELEETKPSVKIKVSLESSMI